MRDDLAGLLADEALSPRNKKQSVENKAPAKDSTMFEIAVNTKGISHNITPVFRKGHGGKKSPMMRH